MGRASACVPRRKRRSRPPRTGRASSAGSAGRSTRHGIRAVHRLCFQGLVAGGEGEFDQPAPVVAGDFRTPSGAPSFPPSLVRLPGSVRRGDHSRLQFVQMTAYTVDVPSELFRRPAGGPDRSGRQSAEFAVIVHCGGFFQISDDGGMASLSAQWPDLSGPERLFSSLAVRRMSIRAAALQPR